MHQHEVCSQVFQIFIRATCVYICEVLSHSDVMKTIT